MNKIKIAVLCILLSLAVVPAGCSAGSAASAVTNISTQAVKQGDLQIGVYADGRISIPLTRVNFAAAGSIAAIHVEVGQTVAAGELLATLDTTDMMAFVADAESVLNKAQVAYDDAVSSRSYSLKSEKIKLDSLYAKYSAGFDPGSYQAAIDEANSKFSDKEAILAEARAALDELLANPDSAGASAVETARKAVESAEAALETAQNGYDNAVTALANARAKYDSDKAAAKEAYDLQKLKYENLNASTIAIVNAEFNLDDAAKKLEKAKAELDNANLYSPAAGKIIDIAYAVGDLVPPSSSAASSSDMITLYDPANVQLVANVSEGDISGLQTGQAMRVGIDALFLENQPGQVIEVNILPKIDNTGIVTYAVTGRLEKPDERILDGMSVFVLFLKKEKPDVLLVSNKAIFIEDGQQYVHVQNTDGSIEKRPVVCGLTNGTLSEVIEGLTAGEKVVTGGIS